MTSRIAVVITLSARCSAACGGIRFSGRGRTAKATTGWLVLPYEDYAPASGPG